MEEIKVGEYCRLARNQGIRKIDEIDKEIYLLDDEIANEWGEIVDYLYIENAKEEIINHSEDIADLIGYGDFINGKMCIDIEHYTRDDGTKGINFVCIGGSVLKENIKNVMTKEQFNQVKYEV